MWIMKKPLLPCCLSLLLFSATSIAADTPTQLAKLEPGTANAQVATPTHWNTLNPKKLQLKSAAALVLDQNGDEIYSKHMSEPLPIA